MTDTPPLHPKEREYLDNASTLVVTVGSADGLRDEIADAIGALEAGEAVETAPILTFANYDELMAAFTPRVLELIEAVRRAQPSSINETARIVDRDVKNVHEELTRLARLGVLYFEEEGRSKRPVVWFDELVIDLPFDSEERDAAPATP